jgi:hypothetical protein
MIFPFKTDVTLTTGLGTILSRGLGSVKVPGKKFLPLKSIKIKKFLAGFILTLTVRQGWLTLPKTVLRW